jgi:hypothetical protein
LWKTVWKLLKKTKNRTAILSSNSALGIYSKEWKPGYNKVTCTPMLIETLYTIVKLCIQPRQYTYDEWIKKMWCFYKMEFYSTTKKNEILLFAVPFGWN